MVTPHPSRIRGLLLLLATLPALLSGPAGAASVPGLDGIRIISAAEVLSEHTTTSLDGRMLFRSPNGDLCRLITSSSDPEISNPGDGRFHPVDETVVLEAVRAIPAEYLSSLQVQIFVLPYPRSGRLSSGADSTAIYLSPGVVALDAGQIQTLVTHELGHAVHRRFLPDADSLGWATYRGLRGIADSVRFGKSAPHARQPHEIFAEDFRVLFGSPIARGDGSVENPEILPPDAVPGLRSFFDEIVIGRSTVADFVPDWRIGPNPVLPGRTLHLTAPVDLSIQAEPRILIFDVLGRAAAEATPTSLGNGQWSVRLPDGLASGAFWVRIVSADRRHVFATLPMRRLS
jgi:hypothetical protein